MGKLLFLLSIVVQVSCSSGSKSTEKKTFSEIENQELKSLRKEVKIAKSLFDLVGCKKKGKLELKNSNPKKIELAAYVEAGKIGGNYLSELRQFSKKENPRGETIFAQGELVHYLEADVYSCK